MVLQTSDSRVLSIILKGFVLQQRNVNDPLWMPDDRAHGERRLGHQGYPQRGQVPREHRETGNKEKPETAERQKNGPGKSDSTVNAKKRVSCWVLHGENEYRELGGWSLTENGSTDACHPISIPGQGSGGRRDRPRTTSRMISVKFSRRRSEGQGSVGAPRDMVGKQRISGSGSISNRRYRIHGNCSEAEIDENLIGEHCPITSGAVWLTTPEGSGHTMSNLIQFI
ncbi:hypothetical protein B0H11DRAFT_2376195 [Mycena galericulata]|nr:hypothetical protein B0H11DRAFT_2376195 [Mycena galericulata]